MTEKSEKASAERAPLASEDFNRIGGRFADQGLDTLRHHAIAKVDSLAFPSGLEEDWRHTRPEKFPFASLMGVAEVPIGLSEYETGAWPRDEIEVRHSSEGPCLPEPVARELIEERSANLERDSMAWFQMACVSQACFIRVKGNSTVTSPMLLKQAIGQETAAAPLVVIVVEKGASVTLLEDLQEGEGSFYFPRWEILVRDGASMRFVSVNRLAGTSSYLARHRFHLGRDANLAAMHVGIGGGVSRLDLDCLMYEPGASAQLSSLFIADGTRHVDFHTLQEHIAPDCQSNLLNKGILRDRSRSVYHGFIRVGERAQHTDAYQKNRNLVFSRQAHADSIPNLEIKANDVKCSHGATVGQVSEDDLFYLMTRGLTRPSAERLLVEGFLDEVISGIEHDSLYDFVRGTVMERLGNGKESSNHK